MSPAQGYRRFLLFFYTAKAGDKLRIYLAFAAKGPGCVLMGLVAHAPFLGRDLARLALRFWAERMGRAGGGFVGRVVHAPLLARDLARLILRFGANALAGGGFADRGCACPFARRLARLTLRFGANALGGAGGGFVGRGCLCLFGPALGSAYSALLGQTHWPGRRRVQWAGLQALQRIFFLCRGIKKQPAAKRWQGAPCFRRKPRRFRL